MSGVQIEMTLQGIEASEAAIGRLASADLDDLAYNVGALLESSTQERIASEKAAPDGTPWAAWSDATAASRHGGQSLLVQGNYLLTSVQNYTEGWTVRIGSNLVYAAIHQEGGKAGRGRKVTIPARPYLGLSDADRTAVEALVADTLSGVLQ